MAALDQHARGGAEAARRVSALQALKHLCTRPADDEKSLAVSVKSAVLGGLVRGRAKRAGGGDSKVKRKNKTTPAVSREEIEREIQQPTEARHDAPCSPPTPPPSEDVSVESSPRDAVEFSSHSLDAQDQEQLEEEAFFKEEAFRPMGRRVSFNEVVMEVYIENRHDTYGSKASRRQHFYTKTELAIFKRTWHWHVKASSSHWPVDRLLRCGCPLCDKDEGRVPVEEGQVPVDEGRVPAEEDLKDEYSHWTWEG